MLSHRFSPSRSTNNCCCCCIEHGRRVKLTQHASHTYHVPIKTRSWFQPYSFVELKYLSLALAGDIHSKQCSHRSPPALNVVMASGWYMPFTFGQSPRMIAGPLSPSSSFSPSSSEASSNTPLPQSCARGDENTQMPVASFVYAQCWIENVSALGVYFPQNSGKT